MSAPGALRGESIRQPMIVRGFILDGVAYLWFCDRVCKLRPGDSVLIYWVSESA